MYIEEDWRGQNEIIIKIQKLYGNGCILHLYLNMHVGVNGHYSDGSLLFLMELYYILKKPSNPIWHLQDKFMRICR